MAIWHLIVLGLVIIVVIMPASKILRRAGWSGWLALLWFIPLANLILLWAFAYGDWPTIPRNSS